MRMAILHMFMAIWKCLWLSLRRIMLSPSGYSFSNVVKASPLLFMARPKCIWLYHKCLWLSQSVYGYIQVHKAISQMFMAIPYVFRVSPDVYG